jgi:hypothetical protein
MHFDLNLLPVREAAYANPNCEGTPDIPFARSPNQALQRAAFGIKCSAAGDRAESALKRFRARVLKPHLAAAELGSLAQVLAQRFG